MGSGEAEVNTEHEQRETGRNGGKEGRKPHWGTESIRGNTWLDMEGGLRLGRALVGQEELVLNKVVRSQV